MHQPAALGKPSSPMPQHYNWDIGYKWDRLGSGMHVSFRTFLHYLLAPGDQSLLHKSLLSYRREHGSIFQKEGKDLISVFYTGSHRAPSQKGKVSRGFSNPQMLPSRWVLEPWCSRQPWVSVHSCSHAEAQLKVRFPWGLQKEGAWFTWLAVKPFTWDEQTFNSLCIKTKNRIAKWWLNFTINIFFKSGLKSSHDHVPNNG